MAGFHRYASDWTQLQIMAKIQASKTLWKWLHGLSSKPLVNVIEAACSAVTTLTTCPLYSAAQCFRSYAVAQCTFSQYQSLELTFEIAASQREAYVCRPREQQQSSLFCSTEPCSQRQCSLRASAMLAIAGAWRGSSRSCSMVIARL